MQFHLMFKTKFLIHMLTDADDSGFSFFLSTRQTQIQSFFIIRAVSSVTGSVTHLVCKLLGSM